MSKKTKTNKFIKKPWMKLFLTLMALFIVAQSHPVFAHDEVDLGDAPDSTNHYDRVMTAYPGVQADFPTVFDGVAPVGPRHHYQNGYWLGEGVSWEFLADKIPDQEFVPNLDTAVDGSDTEHYDDGVILPNFYPCQMAFVSVVVTVPEGSMGGDGYVNIWADWNRNGTWGHHGVCGQDLAYEWAVQNHPIVLPAGPSSTTIQLPAFLPPSHFDSAQDFWLRATLSEGLATHDDGRGPSTGWDFGETEDYRVPPSEFANSDFGDAPDRTNHHNATMMAYPGVFAQFPTVFDGILAYGPRHLIQPGVGYWLGEEISAEFDADLLPDDDVQTNIRPQPNLADLDLADDGVEIPEFIACQRSEMTIYVSSPGGGLGGGEAFVNVWADWDRNGDWEGFSNCPGINAEEWAVQNHQINVPNGINQGLYTFTLPLIIGGATYDNTKDMWLRVTLSDTPATHDDGRGPLNGWSTGETEDYLVKGIESEPDRTDLGDAPDSSNHWGTQMTAYPGVTARFPTVFDGPVPPGPKHGENKEAGFWLGEWVSAEADADILPDDDIFPNLDALNDGNDLDLFDDGVDMPAFNTCEESEIQVVVTVPAGAPATDAYINVWADWNQNGSWGEFSDCPGFTVAEWAIENHPIVLPAGPAQIPMTLPAVIAGGTYVNSKDMWVRVTLSEGRATHADGRGPNNGWQYGETEDYLVEGIEGAEADLGDAPDTTNHHNVDFDAYGGVIGKFPTVYDDTTGLRGPIHHEPRVEFYLGHRVTLEKDADLLPDEDGVTNLDWNSADSDKDLADDGVFIPHFTPCEPARLRLEVTVPPSSSLNNKAFVNAWIDWSQNGFWQEIMRCNEEEISEWVVQNFSLSLTAHGVYSILTPEFLVPEDYDPGSPAWVRVTLSEQPNESIHGAGPEDGFKYGETEDYLYKGDDEDPCNRLQIGTLDGIVTSVVTGDPVPSDITISQDGTSGLVTVDVVTTDHEGRYTIDLSEGSYIVSVNAHSNYFRSEFYDGVFTALGATPVEIGRCDSLEIEHDLEPREDDDAPIVVKHGGAIVNYNPFDNTYSLSVRGDAVEDIGICVRIFCPDGSIPSAVVLEIDGVPYPMTHVGGDEWEVVIPAGAIQNGSVINIIYDCPDDTYTMPLGASTLYDPSGYVTDAVTNLPILNAKVTLHYVTGWLPAAYIGDFGSNVCQSNLSKLATEPWSQPAPLTEGAMVPTGLSSPATDPISPIQFTDETGHYGWDVSTGCWYVLVEKEGYVSQFSPVVGVPTEVTDLDIALQPNVPSNVVLDGVSAETPTSPILILSLFICLGLLTVRSPKQSNHD